MINVRSHNLQGHLTPDNINGFLGVIEMKAFEAWPKKLFLAKKLIVCNFNLVTTCPGVRRSWGCFQMSSFLTNIPMTSMVRTSALEFYNNLWGLGSK